MRLFSLSLCFIFLFIACKKEEPIGPPKPSVPPSNEAPTDFTVTVIAVGSGSAQIEWGKATDPEGDTVSYRIYLQDSLIAQTSVHNLKIEGLNELTNYQGKVIASDRDSNVTTADFNFTTSKYYLQYSKYISYQTSLNTSINTFKELPGGGFIVAGPSQMADLSGYQFFAMKFDTTGQVNWAQQYNFPVSAGGVKVGLCSDGGFLLSSSSYILKVQANGNLSWSKQVSSFVINNFALISMAQEAPSGEIFAVGSRASADTAVQTEAVVLKLSSNGNLLWEKTFKSTLFNFFNELHIEGSALVVMGTTENSGMTRAQYLYTPFPKMDYLLMKFDFDGNPIWSKNYGNYLVDYPKQLLKTSDGGYLLAGSSDDHMTDEHGSLIKVDAQGNQEWSLFHMDPNKENSIQAVDELADGSFIAIGKEQWPVLKPDIAFYKVSASGQLSWKTLQGDGSLHLAAAGVLAVTDGGYLAPINREGVNQLWLIKTDDKGYFEN